MSKVKGMIVLPTNLRVELYRGNYNYESMIKFDSIDDVNKLIRRLEELKYKMIEEEREQNGST